LSPLPDPNLAAEFVESLGRDFRGAPSAHLADHTLVATSRNRGRGSGRAPGSPAERTGLGTVFAITPHKKSIWARTGRAVNTSSGGDWRGYRKDTIRFPPFSRYVGITMETTEPSWGKVRARGMGEVPRAFFHF